jgi:hypothetical protein
MKELLAYVGAELRKPEEEISDDLVFLINSRIKPPKPVDKEDIFVRTMFLVSDEVNSYGGRFPLDELYKISQLVIDSPVMVGHTKEKLPIARNFKAEVVEKDGQNWVKVWFYWLKSAKDALPLKKNIDHGIYKECSLGFVFGFPECSVCGQDMRRCQHVPFKTYPTEDGEKEAYFNYRNITRVLETSLVYRGAVPNTSMSDQLRVFDMDHPKGVGEDLPALSHQSPGDALKVSPFEFIRPTNPNKTSTSSNEIFHLEDLASLSGVFLIEPKYDGIRAQIHKKDNQTRIFIGTGKPIENRFPLLVKDILSIPQESFILDGGLVKYKGNSRLSHEDAAAYCHQPYDGSSPGKDGSVDDSHFKFKLFDLLFLNREDLTALPLEERKRLLDNHFADTSIIQKVKYKRVDCAKISSEIKAIASADGAMIRKADSGYFEGDGWYEWKRHFDLDVLVRDVQKNKGSTYNYTCAVSTEDEHLVIGTTYSSPMVAQAGDVIRVRVDQVIRSENGLAWKAPRVLEKRWDREDSDPISVAERMMGPQTSTDRRRLSTANNCQVVDDGLWTEDRFVLQLHWWGKAKHHDLRFQKGNVAFGLTIFELDIDELNRGKRFLCEWKDEHDPKWMDFEGDIPPNQDGQEGNPSKNLVAHIKIIDRGKYQFLERESDFSTIQMKDRILNGIYQVRRIRLKGKDRWLFYKRSTA